MANRLCIAILLFLGSSLTSFGTPTGGSNGTSFDGPLSLQSRLSTDYRLLTGGAGSNPYPQSAVALQSPILSMWESAYHRVMSDIQDGVRYILGTKNEWTFVLTGTGSTATNAILDNLMEPGEKILFAIAGGWAEVASVMAERLGGNVIRMRKPLGQRFELDEIKVALETHRPQLFFLVNGESTSGVYQPMDGIGDLCIKHNVLFVADVIGTVGQQPILMDERKIDGVLLNSQKGCGSVVGLAPVSLSARAVKKIKERKSLPRAYHTDFRNQAKAWFIDKSVDMHHAFLHSTSGPLFYSLREGLAKVAEEGLSAVWERHARVNAYFHEKAEKIGLKFFVPREIDRLIGTTLFHVPAGKDSVKMEAYILTKFGIEVTPGLGPTIGKVVRVGLFGRNANEIVADSVIAAIEDAINSPQTNA